MAMLNNQMVVIMFAGYLVSAMSCHV
jgi:hypothetical protein